MAKVDKATILIVDDKEANILSLEGLLSAKDRIFLRAANGPDALKLTLEKNVDLIILDVQMPGMDGFEVAQILRSNKRTRDIPIIFATAESKERQFIMKGYEEGAIDYLFKPLEPVVVRSKVAVLLKLQLQRKQLLEKNKSLQKSALLINNSADIIGIVDAGSLRIEEVNAAFYSITGYTPEEVRESSLMFFLASEDRPLVEALSGKGQESFGFESRIYSKSRSIIWLQWKVVCKDKKWFVNARDITEVKEVEQLRNFLATVVKQSADAIYIQDNEGKIISWNEGAEKNYGYAEEEALKMNITNLIPPHLHTETEELISRAYQGMKVERVETKRITKHGRLIDVLFSASVISDGRDALAITERDITIEKTALEMLRESEAKFRTLFNNSPFPKWVYDVETLRFLEVNETAIRNYGYSKEEFLNMKITDIRPQEDVQELIDFITNDNSDENSTVWRHLLKSGEVILVEITSHKINYKAVKAVMVIAKNITEQKQAEEKIRQLNEQLEANVRQLEATNHELESFSYSVSHDLRAPLRVLSGYSRLLERDIGNGLSEEGKRLLEGIAANTKKMGTLIDDLLEFSRLGRKEVHKSEINMDELVAALLSDPSSGFSDATIEKHPLLPASGDHALIRQVWLNLLSNAVKYSSKTASPRVEAGSFHKDGEVVYYVKDNGAGFDMRYADKLFGVFQRLHSPREFEGTGIGLAIVHRVVTKHGGRVWAEAVPDKGASFYFTLPVN